MNTNISSWLTEHTLTPYPLTKSFGYDGFIIDANFIQFDNFIPVLQTISLNSTNIFITIIFDKVTKILDCAISSINTVGSELRIYDGARYLGLLVFGSGVQRFVDSNTDNITLDLNLGFLPHTVKSIPSNCGVFALNNQFGALGFTSDDNINYDVAGNDITFNAIYVPPSPDTPYLKTLNIVGPTLNSVFIKSTELIKVSGQSSTVEISLIGNTLNTNPIITTTGDGL